MQLLRTLIVIAVAASGVIQSHAKDIKAQGYKVEGATNLQTIRIEGDTLFASNDDKLTSGGKKALDDLIKKNVFTAMTRQIITGHADRMGTPEHNRDLSLRRATAVKNYLESRDRNLRFEVAGKGDTLPLVQCPGKMAREALIKCLAPNRRVEIDPIY